MLLRCILLFCLCARLSYGVLYDCYKGEPLTDKEIETYEAESLIKNCTVEIKPCNATECRRVDGSCNNLKYPTKGTHFQPQARILPAHYYNGSYPRKCKNGEDLPLARVVRTTLVKQGKSSHECFNHNVPGYLIYCYNDIGSVHDAENFLIHRPYCCEKEHMNDYGCTPNIIPEDDPVHRYSGIRCMNSTRAATHQEYGCTKDPVPSPIALQTQCYDTSMIYNAFNEGEKAVRSYVGGMLIVEEENGHLFPPAGDEAFRKLHCPNNQEGETRCFKNHVNSLLPITLFNIWGVMHHNYIAKQLAAVNPCWDDDRLFYVARDINIAYHNQMYFYELMIHLQGYQNLVEFGVINDHPGFRDIYDEDKWPAVTVEYTYAMRYFHVLQESTAKLHDKKGNFIKNYPLLNVTFRIGNMAKDNNLEYFTQSTFRAPCRDLDHSADHDMCERAFPIVQLAIDALAGDINKGRSFGVAPYIDYVYHFTGRNITCFDDLLCLMTKDKIAMLKELYPSVEDIELMAGFYAESGMKGGQIGTILAHVINDNSLRAIQGDRHWYERQNRPCAFTRGQLLEVRKATLASFMCNAAETVDEIPRHAFLTVSPKNPVVKCEDITHIDFTAWADDACNAVDCSTEDAE